jgi:plastocyanin
MIGQLFILFCLASGIVTGACGTILGTVRAEGKAEVSDGGKGGGKYDSRKFKFVERVNYAELQDFVVHIEGKVTNAPPVRAKTFQIITQRDAVFRPHVLPLIAGSTIEWPNKDDIFHNVFSMSESNPFDLGLYKDPEVKKVEFRNPGRVDVFCSIHSKMSCVLLVLENQFFASTDSSGRYKIENVPPGVYRLRAWHERLPTESREITVPETGEVRVDFILGIRGLPQY